MYNVKILICISEPTRTLIFKKTQFIQNKWMKVEIRPVYSV